MKNQKTSAKIPKMVPPRVFPFIPGTKFKPADYGHAETALKIFGTLWQAVKNGELTEKDIQKLFFKSISDPITYRESWKCGKFWSVAAWERACADGGTNKNGLVSEHVLPRQVALQHSLTLDTLDKAKNFICEMSFECVITKEENKKLDGNGLKKVGFPDNPWKRYQNVGIKILDVQHPRGTHFLNCDDQATLEQLGLLVKHLPQNCDCHHCVRQS